MTSSGTAKGQAAIERPQLEQKSWTETDQEGRTLVEVTHLQRGFLFERVQSFHHPSLWFQAMDERPTPRQSLERHLEKLREILSESGLPTDRTPFCLKVGEREWREYKPDRCPLGKWMRDYPWTLMIEHLTEPLSRERIAGEWLEYLLIFMEVPKDEIILELLVKCMDLAGDFRLSGTVNALAAQGKAARTGRAQGPRKRRDQGSKRQALILAFANEYVQKHPALRGKASAIGAAIADDVNRELALQSLLPAKRTHLSPKTITDRIRDSIRG